MFYLSFFLIDALFMLEFNASALLLLVISVCLSKYLKRKVAVSITEYFQVQNVPMCIFTLLMACPLILLPHIITSLVLYKSTDTLCFLHFSGWTNMEGASMCRRKKG